MIKEEATTGAINSLSLTNTAGLVLFGKIVNKLYFCIRPHLLQWKFTEGRNPSICFKTAPLLLWTKFGVNQTANIDLQKKRTFWKRKKIKARVYIWSIRQMCTVIYIWFWVISVNIMVLCKSLMKVRWGRCLVLARLFSKWQLGHKLSPFTANQ